MAQVEQTLEEVQDSLNGHEEMAVSQHFGKPSAWFGENDPMMWARTLVFVVERRKDGANDDDARNIALDMTFKVLADYFPDESVEEVAVAAGKDEQSPEPSPEISLSSVS